MLRTVVIAALVAAALAPHALAGARGEIMPGVTYRHVLEYTVHGPVSMYEITAPRPGGLYGLKPVLSNGLVSGRETVSSMERDVRSQMTTIGVNGDFFNWVQGYPSGLLVQNGVLEHQSLPGRSALGVDASGMLHVERVGTYGSWRGSGSFRSLDALNQPPTPNSVSLYTPVWGTQTPVESGWVEAVLSALPPTRPNATLTAVVTDVHSGGPTPIPAGGGVLVARGSPGALLAAEAQVGQAMTFDFVLKPDPWNTMVDALGGGPVLVRNGQPIFRADEAFTPSQVLGRDPRTAVGQRADGTVVIVAADGRQPWYSVGVTNFDLALTLVRLGCITGSAVDSGGSTTVAFDGRVLNRPSDLSGERPVAEALLVTYAGVYAPPVPPAVSPNGDGVGESESLSYKIVRPSRVTADLIAPGGSVRMIDSGQRLPRTYSFNWSARTLAGTPESEGLWHWRVSAIDDLGHSSVASRAFSLDDTLGFLTLKVTRRGFSQARFLLAHSALIRVTIETRAGEVLRTVVTGVRTAGPVVVRWNGRDAHRRFLGAGTYLLRVSATSQVGSTSLVAPFRVR